MQSPYEIPPPSDETIDLLSGFPSKSSLVKAAHIMKNASDELFDMEIKNNGRRLIYARNEDITEMLDTLAGFLSEHYEDEVIASNLVLTGGASSSFVYLWTHLLPRNRKVIVSTPTYQLLLNCLKDLNYDIESVPEDSEGLDLDLLENILKKEYELYGLNGGFCCGIYIVPIFSNPTGLLYSEGFAKVLLELVTKYNALVVTDDVYNLLYTTNSSPKRFVSYETSVNQGHIISNGSFSKYLSPAIRLGWIEAHPPIIDKIRNWGLLQSANCLGQLSALIVTTAIKNGSIARHIVSERQNIKSRLEIAKSILAQNLTNDFKISGSLGGYFIWINLPENFQLDLLQKQCSERSVLFLSGNIFTNLRQSNKIRISVSRADDIDKLKKGIEIICTIINNIK